MGIIEIENLKKVYTTYERGSSFFDTLKSLFVRKKIEVHALKGISLEIEEGELLGFIGPNGAGKSTTLKILTGVLHPTSGHVSVMGFVPWKQRSSYVGNIGAVFGQKSQLIWDIPPLDSFEMNRAIYSIPKNEYKKRLNLMADLLGVESVIRKPTRQLSLGERMKCEFIMAMLHDPKIVFLDEPTIGLDVITKDRIRGFIREMNSQGKTIILTTHDLGDIEHLAKRVVMINHGSIVFDDALDALRSYMGARKLVTLSTHAPLPDLGLPGVAVKTRQSDFHAELELDISLTGLNQFIEYVNKSSSIKDMSVQDLPIDEVIKNLYQK